VFIAVDELRAAALDNFNLDLMYALPGQSLSEAIFDIDTAIALQPAHISHYELTLEPGTVFYSRPPEGLPDVDIAWDIQLACQERLAAAGYEQYEVSAYARPNRRCRHNLNYWCFGDYLGIGAGAHGKVTDPSGVWRTSREKQPRTYLAATPKERLQRSRVEAAMLPFEFMLNALRLHDGFALSDFERMTGLPSRAIADQLEQAVSKALLTRRADRWCTTSLGRRFLNDVQVLFLPESEASSAASS
jgi:oxygen-independent coproporphyrinogen-3 oxidase